ncbi:hypothetical protein [Mycolicibacterium wolinskyi]|uniref:hypothetical protein n=1 Tax=Mycolicibacterium wolinskyi TaxID=59750 RepID=UPI0039177895
MSADVTTHIDVREPTEGEVGCVSARVGGKFGREVCYAVGREFGDWYITIQPDVWVVAGIEPQPIHVAAGRRDAERLVRLLAELYSQIVSAA